MEAMSILAPQERCVRAKLQLLLRLWLAKQKYGLAGRSGGTSAERVRFHLSQLEAAWCRVVEFQKVLGLEVAHFVPREQFETIYIVSRLIDDELDDENNTILDIRPKWNRYRSLLNRLDHHLNPFEFGEVSGHCAAVVRELAQPVVLEEPPVPMPPPKLPVEPGAALAMMQNG